MDDGGSRGRAEGGVAASRPGRPGAEGIRSLDVRPRCARRGVRPGRGSTTAAPATEAGAPAESAAGATADAAQAVAEDEVEVRRLARAVAVGRADPEARQVGLDRGPVGGEGG